jgi:hypothetical protein
MRFCFSICPSLSFKGVCHLNSFDSSERPGGDCIDSSLDDYFKVLKAFLN